MTWRVLYRLCNASGSLARPGGPCHSMRMKTADRVRGVYLITDDAARDLGALERWYAPLLAAGVSVLQYRDKGSACQRRRDEAGLLARLCREQGVLFIVNDDVELAGVSGADGVHLGRDDQAIAGARHLLGPEAVIGASCYGSLERAERLAADGADYLAFGSVFASPTKPQAPRVTLETLAEARRQFSHPLVAIGGIDADNAAAVAATGVDALAVIQGIHGATDPVRAVKRLATLMKR